MVFLILELFVLRLHVSEWRILVNKYIVNCILLVKKNLVFNWIIATRLLCSSPIILFWIFFLNSKKFIVNSSFLPTAEHKPPQNIFIFIFFELLRSNSLLSFCSRLFIRWQPSCQHLSTLSNQSRTLFIQLLSFSLATYLAHQHFSLAIRTSSSTPLFYWLFHFETWSLKTCVA